MLEVEDEAVPVTPVVMGAVDEAVAVVEAEVAMAEAVEVTVEVMTTMTTMTTTTRPLRP